MKLQDTPGNKDRIGLAPLVVGLLKGLSKHMHIELTKVEQVEFRETGADHDVFHLEWIPIPPNTSATSGDSVTQPTEYEFSVSPKKFTEIFPFHFVMDSHFKLKQIGHVLHRICPDMFIGDAFLDHFQVERPINFEMTMENICQVKILSVSSSNKNNGKEEN